MFAAPDSSFVRPPDILRWIRSMAVDVMQGQPNSGRWQFIRSNSFRWALAVAGVLAVFMIALFGFIYVKIDNYLIERTDRMLVRQIAFMVTLPMERQLNAIEDHLRQDSRG